jgi:integrase
MLTDKECKTSVCPPDKARVRLYDAGGLYLQVSPSGSRRWFLKYRHGKTEKQLALGSFPEVSLKLARELRDKAKKQREVGQDPIQAKKVSKLIARSPALNSLQEIALDWYERQRGGWSAMHSERVKRQLERDLFPYLGQRTINDITAPELLATLRRIEERGAVETAHRVRVTAGLIWRYALSIGAAERDISADLKGALTAYRGSHFGAITDPLKLGELLRAIQAYKGGPVVRAALLITPYVFSRPGELRGMAWAELDLEAGIWTIPAARMKRKKDGKENGAPHIVPLCKQVVQILIDLKPYTFSTGLVFPGERQRDKPISDNSVRTALMSLGYGSDVQTWHGFRATARTMLDEKLEIDPALIEVQLAHEKENDANKGAYNRASYVKQRAAMMQTWADYLDRLRDGADVIQLRVPS